ncbi:hypothetical protein CC1G_13396 [Coprinopsis cinerea okayama7|uniref:Uncharacterized protein n=1 Tax=Coprinopsis cinerea (strain Okayama-7 / 130 / ATCC MYA-4618 / FGSC 9003) TaxID=240176 RepID=A8PID0_COPC7|nr:hypothetical protein CC1G_13396 [Coprinopsis cinerea okayama7\|eukprot:XP_001841553.1 hypothetical protein CC1G_13396 [Coprinopsis cinerea okayama7\
MGCDALSTKLDVLDSEIKDANRLAIVTQSFDAVTNVAGIINGYWRSLRSAEAHNDPDKFTNVMDAIGSQSPTGISMTLSVLHEKLTAPMPALTDNAGTQVNRPLLESIRSLLQDRAVAENKCFTYDIVAFKADMARWLEYISNLQTKGIALAVMQENFRLVVARNNPESYPKDKLEKLEKSVTSTIKSWKDTHQQRLKAYEAALVGGPLRYSATPILDNAANIRVDEQYPKLWNLMLSSGKCCTLFTPDKNVFAGESGKKRIITTWSLEDRPSFSQAFALVRVPEKNVFQLRTSRFGFASEMYTVETKNNDSPLHVKIIPRQDGGNQEPLVRILLLNEQLSGVDETIDVSLRDPNLPGSIAFNNPSDPGGHLLHRMGPRKRVLFWINNLTPSRHVFVLQSARVGKQQDEVHLVANVWLPGERLPIGLSQRGAEREDLNANIRLRIYSLRDGEAVNRDNVHSMLRLHPSHGRLVLDEGRADYLCDLFLRIVNPTGFARNYVGTALAYGGNDHPWGMYNLCEGDLSRWLDSHMVVQKESLEYCQSGLRLRYDIGGSDTPDGSIDIKLS